MKAAAGDRLVVEGTHGDGVRRIGVVMELRHPDGSPPSMVRWVDGEHESLVFPGPDAHVVTFEAGPGFCSSAVLSVDGEDSRRASSR